MILLRPNALLGSKAKPHRAHRLIRRSAIRTRNARNAQRIIAFRRNQRTQRHLAHHLLAHRTIMPQRIAVHIHQLLLGLVGISDIRALKKRRAACDAGQFRRQQPARARFGTGNFLFTRNQFRCDVFKSCHGVLGSQRSFQAACRMAESPSKLHTIILKSISCGITSPRIPSWLARTKRICVKYLFADTSGNAPKLCGISIVSK